MPLSGFIPNKDFPEELEKQPEYTDGLAGQAQGAADLAKTYAPVRTGAYRDSIGVVVDNKKIYVSAKDFKAHWIEYGTSDTPTFAPLRRGVTSAGLKFKADK